MTMFVEYETECFNCKKPMKAYKSNLNLKYKGGLYGFNLCKVCMNWCVIDVDEVIKKLKEVEKK